MDTAWTPIDCTLPTADQPLRIAEFDALLRSGTASFTGPDHRRLRLTLTRTPALASAAAQLAMEETECCSFFTFTLRISPDELTVDVTVPDARTDVLDAMTARILP